MFKWVKKELKWRKDRTKMYEQEILRFEDELEELEDKRNKELSKTKPDYAYLLFMNYEISKTAEIIISTEYCLMRGWV